VICAVENVPNPDEGGLRSHTFREDDVPPESPEE
jgi:hypothetical protein